MEGQARSDFPRQGGLKRGAVVGVHAGGRGALPRNRKGRKSCLLPHPQVEQRRGGHGRQRRAGAGQHRSSGGDARYGRQMRALPRIRGHRRRPRMPCHTGHGRDNRHGEEHRADIRRHKSGRHFCAALFRNRTQAERDLRHSRVPRRPARHGDSSRRRARKRT